jgi:hypothetical protein
MTGAERQQCDDPEAMVPYLRSKRLLRKLWLYAVDDV